jgi:hypothetical protein
MFNSTGQTFIFLVSCMWLAHAISVHKHLTDFNWSDAEKQHLQKKVRLHFGIAAIWIFVTVAVAWLT